MHVCLCECALLMERQVTCQDRPFKPHPSTNDFNGRIALACSLSLSVSLSLSSRPLLCLAPSVCFSPHVYLSLTPPCTRSLLLCLSAYLSLATVFGQAHKLATSYISEVFRPVCHVPLLCSSLETWVVVQDWRPLNVGWAKGQIQYGTGLMIQWHG